MEVLVFKTSVVTDEHVDQAQRILNAIEHISEWNFDLDDCDKILRVVGNDQLSPNKVAELLFAAGISCQELPG